MLLYYHCISGKKMVLELQQYRYCSFSGTIYCLKKAVIVAGLLLAMSLAVTFSA